MWLWISGQVNGLSMEFLFNHISAQSAGHVEISAHYNWLNYSVALFYNADTMDLLWDDFKMIQMTKLFETNKLH